MVVVPFPDRRSARRRLTGFDRTELFRRWPRGELIEIDKGAGPLFACFLARSHGGEFQFIFWRETGGSYVREDTRTALIVRGATLAQVWPEELTDRRRS